MTCWVSREVVPVQHKPWQLPFSLKETVLTGVDTNFSRLLEHNMYCCQWYEGTPTIVVYSMFMLVYLLKCV